jgi:hypothetical protein
MALYASEAQTPVVAVLCSSPTAAVKDEEPKASSDSSLC